MLMKPQWPSDAFEQWWQHYPRRVAKKFAHRVFERLRSSGEVPFEVLLSATQNYARSMVGKDMKYVAHPATWLNAGRWDDDENALLDVKVSAPAMPMANGKVLIRRGSPQALAWEKHRGRSFPWGQSGVWAVDSEYPPEERK
jgi:hypothetical protein